jgi:ABC-type transport system involved in cytochrome bd biosynthesis fused ATPase/permease subunit
MEEPWYGLKKEEKEQVMQYLLNQKKHTLVIVTNDPLYHQHCDKIISLPEGNIVINSKHNA